MTITPIMSIDRRLKVYLLDLDFSEYTMEMSIQNTNELWGMLKDYIKEECNE
jgi:hypothetical protein